MSASTSLAPGGRAFPHNELVPDTYGCDIAGSLPAQPSDRTPGGGVSTPPVGGEFRVRRRRVRLRLQHLLPRSRRFMSFNPHGPEGPGVFLAVTEPRDDPRVFERLQLAQHHRSRPPTGFHDLAGARSTRLPHDAHQVPCSAWELGFEGAVDRRGEEGDPDAPRLSSSRLSSPPRSTIR